MGCTVITWVALGALVALTGCYSMVRVDPLAQVDGRAGLQIDATLRGGMRAEGTIEMLGVDSLNLATSLGIETIARRDVLLVNAMESGEWPGRTGSRVSLKPGDLIEYRSTGDVKLRATIRDIDGDHLLLRRAGRPDITTPGDSLRDVRVRRLNHGRTFLVVATPLFTVAFVYFWALAGMGAALGGS